jgi:hypothetical protein
MRDAVVEMRLAYIEERIANTVCDKVGSQRPNLYDSLVG